MAYSPNQLQLTHLLQAVFDRLEQSRGLLATGGTTSTIIDTTISDDLQDDDFKGQVAFVTYDAGGAGAAPEGEFATVTGYTASTKTLSFAASAFTAAVAAGDRVTMVRNSQYPVNDVIRIVNAALRNLGRFPVPDTSLTTAESQTEYTLPIAIKGGDILNVEYQGITGNSVDNAWVPAYWKVTPAQAGSTETLIVPQLPSGRTLRVTYFGVHPVVVNYYDPVSEYIPREHAIAACALAVAKWKRNASAELLPVLERDYINAITMHPLRGFVPAAQGMPHFTNNGQAPVARNRNGVAI